MTGNSEVPGGIASEVPSEHDEVQLLLPWWVNKTLDDQLQKRVAEHLPQCAICQQEVRHLAVLSNTLNDNTRIDGALVNNTRADRNDKSSVESHLSQVMQRIDAQDSASRSASRSGESLLQRLHNTLSPILFPATAYRWGSAVAVVCVLVLGFQLLPGQSGGEFSVLSSGEQSTDEMQLIVHFSEAVSPADAQELLMEHSPAQTPEFILEQLDDTSYVITYSQTIEASTLMNTVRELQATEAIEHVELEP